MVHGPWSEVVRFRFLFWRLLLESLSTSDLTFLGLTDIPCTDEDNKSSLSHELL